MTTQAQRIIDKFGGLAALARALGHANPTTVQGWKERGVIPPKHHQAVWNAAKSAGIPIAITDFVAIDMTGSEAAA